MPRAGFEPKATAFHLAKTVHALDRIVAAIGNLSVNYHLTMELERPGLIASIGRDLFSLPPSSDRAWGSHKATHQIRTWGKVVRL
jgi:hypothetical protein